MGDENRTGRKGIGRVSAAAAAVMLLWWAAAAGAATVTVDYDTEYQTIEGWGASSNFYESLMTGLKQPYRSDAYDLIFDDLGMNTLCIRLYSDFQPAEGAAYDWTVMANQRWIMNAAKARGVIDYVWVKVSSPPGWMKNNGDNANGGHVLPEYQDDYAQYLNDYLGGMEDIWGFTTDAVSIFNEPGFGEPGVGYDSTDTNPEQYRDMLKEAGAKFAAEELPQVLMGSECGKISDTDHGALGAGYMQAIFDDPVARGYLHHVSVHQYGDIGWLYDILPPDDWPGLRDLSAANGKNVWETEIMVSGGSIATQDIVEGLNAAKLIWQAMTVGNVTAWHYWHYYGWSQDTPGHENSSSGVLSIKDDTTYYVWPRYHVLKQWARHVKPGAIRVEASDDHADIYVTAFKRDDEAVIVAFNFGDAAVPVTFNCTSIGGNVRHIRTSAGENYATRPNIVPSGNSFSLTMIGWSISTLTVPFSHAALAPVADFRARPRWGAGKAKVSFADTSTNFPTSWAWDFDNDGSVDSTEQNPTHTYRSVGRHTVKLMATNGEGSDDEVKVGYVKVSPPGRAIDASGHTIINGRAEEEGVQWEAFVFDPTTLYSYECPTGVPLLSPEIIDDPTDPANRVVRLRSQSYGGRRQAGGCTTVAGFNTSGESIENVESISCRVYLAPGTARELWVATMWLDLNDNDQFHYTDDLLVGNVQHALDDGWNRVVLDTMTDAHPGGIPKEVLTNDGELKLGFFFATQPGAESLTAYIDDVAFIGGGPVADFSASPRVGSRPLSVQFADESEGDIGSWEWDFGDEGSSFDQNPSHVYENPGTYTVRLKVDGAEGPGQERKEDYVHVIGAPHGLMVKNEGGVVVAAFTAAGDLLLRGTLSESAAISPSGSTSEFVVKNQSGDTVVLIDRSGNMRLAGVASELREDPLSPGGSSLVVMDGSGKVVSYVDASGNLRMLGGVVEGAL